MKEQSEADAEAHKTLLESKNEDISTMSNKISELEKKKGEADNIITKLAHDVQKEQAKHQRLSDELDARNAEFEATIKNKEEEWAKAIQNKQNEMDMKIEKLAKANGAIEGKHLTKYDDLAIFQSNVQVC